MSFGVGTESWRLAGVLALALVVAAASGCDRSSSRHVGAPAPAEVTPEPPDDLLAEATVATPDATWQRLQRGLAAGPGLLPGTLGGLVCTVAGLDARLEGEISGTSPAYVVVAGDPAAPAWVVAVRLVEERRVRPLFEGSGAIFAARDAGGLLELTPIDKAARPGSAVGNAVGRPAGASVLTVAGIAPGGWLVVGSSPARLADLALYATGNLARRPVAETPITIDVAPAALRGSLATTLSRRWTDAEKAMLDDDRKLRDAHGGRAPDFGDPRAIVGALDGWTQKKIAALRDLAGARIAIDVGEDRLRAVVTASRATPDGAAAGLLASFHAGDLTPLTTLPRTTVLALLSRDDAAERAADAADLEDGLAKTLGRRLTPADARRVRAAIDDWSSARGDWATLALTLTPTARGAIADVSSTDPARASRAVREALDLYAQVPAIHDPVGAWLHARSLGFSAPVLPGGARVAMATFATDDPSPLSLAWSASAVDAGGASLSAGHVAHVKLALGAAPLPLLAAPAPGEALGDDAEMRAAFASLGEVAGAIILRPSVVPGCSASGAILVAWGPRGDNDEKVSPEKAALWGTITASDSSLTCVAKSFF